VATTQKRSQKLNAKKMKKKIAKKLLVQRLAMTTRMTMKVMIVDHAEVDDHNVAAHVATSVVALALNHPSKRSFVEAMRSLSR
jgi:hypothetical protein